jgi:hypothetical protein
LTAIGGIDVADRVGAQGMRVSQREAPCIHVTRQAGIKRQTEDAFRATVGNHQHLIGTKGDGNR